MVEIALKIISYKFQAKLECFVDFKVIRSTEMVNTVFLNQGIIPLAIPDHSVLTCISKLPYEIECFSPKDIHYMRRFRMLMRNILKIAQIMTS